MSKPTYEELFESVDHKSRVEERLLRERDELLEALEEGAACLKAQIDGSGGYAVEEVLEGMLEAIAKAKGGRRLC